MTTPTQAQIEAAAKPIKEIFAPVTNGPMAEQTFRIAAESAIKLKDEP